MTQTVKLRTLGSCLVMTVPAALAQALKWKAGQLLQLGSNGRSLSVARQSEPRKKAKKR